MRRVIIAAAAAVAAGVAVPAQAHAATFDICPSGRAGVVSGTPTSCPFADNVRIAWFSQRGNPVIAFSPVMNAWYSMSCERSVETVGGMTVNGWTCYGGNNAEVVIW